MSPYVIYKNIYKRQEATSRPKSMKWFFYLYGDKRSHYVILQDRYSAIVGRPGVTLSRNMDKEKRGHQGPKPIK